MQRLDAAWLRDLGTQRIFELLREESIFVVGGCVRNTLLGMPVKDIDFATSALPEKVVRSAEAAGLRVIPTGIDHGTVTVIAQDRAFEITTFRRDVTTDGRRAIVSYAKSLEEDARRRDFTVNAIYADADGRIQDPTGGLLDIEARRIRFIEDSEQRIQEDYLRSLRFFRFCAWYADPDKGMDPDALDAISRNLDGLETLSRERVGSEIIRLLEAPDPAPAVAAMQATGVLSRVLPGADPGSLAYLISLEHDNGLEPEAIRRLALLGGAYETLRLSRAQTARINAILEGTAMSPGEAGYRHGYAVGRDAVLISAASLTLPLAPEAIEAARAGATSRFPVEASDLMDTLQGKALGDALRRMEKRWIASGFTLSRDALLSQG